MTSSNTGGSRNERLIFVRGFDRFQVPLLIDGIRVYLPADNRLDYGRFVTPDIAEIQVAKGYASVLDEPGALGGLVNLVTRKPSDALEIEARGTLMLDRDLDYAGYNVFGLVGTRQDKFYVQGSYARNLRDHFDLASGFTPTPNEDGGMRDLSDTRDWRVSAKAGFTPNATDEYSISYTRQEGRKNAPIETTFPLPSQRFWNWPFWDLDSIYFLSTTALGGKATLKTRAYRNTFVNLLSSSIRARKRRRRCRAPSTSSTKTKPMAGRRSSTCKSPPATASVLPRTTGATSMSNSSKSFRRGRPNRVRFRPKTPGRSRPKTNSI